MDKQEFTNAVEIGILKTHVNAIHTRLDKQEVKIDQGFGEQGEKLDDIFAIINKGKGAWLGFIMAGSAGAAMGKLLGMLGTRLFP